MGGLLDLESAGLRPGGFILPIRKTIGMAANDAPASI